MSNKIYVKEDWLEYRNEILDLVLLYNQVKEYSDFDKEKIEYIESYFYLSKKNAIASFFIKLGFIIGRGKPSFNSFLSHEDSLLLNQIYKPKLKFVRDKIYAHNDKSGLPKDFNFSNEDINTLYDKVIYFSEQLDKKYDDVFCYEGITNAYGIKSLESLISDSSILHKLEQEIIDNGFEASVEMDIQSGKITVIKSSK